MRWAVKNVANLTLLGLFLLVIFTVPVTDAILDVKVQDEEEPVALTLFDRAPTEEHLREYEERLEQGSWYEQEIRPLFQIARYKLLRDLGEKALRGAREGWYFYTPSLHYLTGRHYRDLLVPLDHDPVPVIADFVRQLRSRDIKVLVMPIPGKPTIHPERLVPEVAPDPGIAAHTRQVMEELRAKGVEVLDLHRAFLAERQRDPDRVLYMRSDTHWTGEGAVMAARTVARRIRQEKWYAGVQRTRYTREKVVVTRRGDIPRMTRIPDQEQLFEPEKVICYQVRDSDGELYYEPDEPAAAPILVLGDSFSRVFELDEPEAAGWVSNLAYELKVPVSAIINDGGASTLVRQQLARDLSMLEGTRVVVWAFVERDIRFGLQGWQPIDLWPDGPSQGEGD
jgi:hypothetical protein